LGLQRLFLNDPENTGGQSSEDFQRHPKNNLESDYFLIKVKKNLCLTEDFYSTIGCGLSDFFKPKPIYKNYIDQ
jgi:hypothetical protein